VQSTERERCTDSETSKETLNCLKYVLSCLLAGMILLERMFIMKSVVLQANFRYHIDIPYQHDVAEMLQEMDCLMKTYAY